MSELKKPEAGEWWQRDWCRVLIVGRKLNGNVITETINGFIGTMQDEEEWQHLPDCDSFEWQPETFPQWYVAGPNNLWINTVAIRMDGKNNGYRIQRDGEESSFSATDDHIAEMLANKYWAKATQAEAEARVKQPDPVESPDDWVTQDRVPARAGIDERRFFIPLENRFGPWDKVGFFSNGTKHGQILEGDRIELRCRRRDLPSLPQETPKREYVRCFASWKNGRLYSWPDRFDPKDRELKHDGTGFYLEDAK